MKKCAWLTPNLANIFCRENIYYYEMWYFLCVTNTKLFILIHTKDKKKMKKATNHVWSIEQTNHARLKVCFSSWWIFLLYIFKLFNFKELSLPVKMRGIYDTTSSDKHLAVPSMKRLGSLRKRPFFHSKSVTMIWNWIFILKIQKYKINIIFSPLCLWLKNFFQIIIY